MQDTEQQLEQALAEIARVKAELGRERKLRAEVEERLEKAERDTEITTLQIEEAFGKANQSALKAEFASIELNQIFNTSIDARWVIDRDCTILKVNDTFLRLLRRTRAEVAGQKCFSILPGPNCRSPRCPLAELSRGEKPTNCDIELDPGEGGVRFYIVSATPYYGLDGVLFGIVESYRDITDRKRAEEALQQANEKLRQLVSLDGLTQIANRRRFDECFRTEWKRMAREDKPLSLVLCDLDCFKLYNDTYGHQMGDDCLRAVAQCLQSQLKRPSDLSARYGGEEFVALLPDTDSSGALQVAESIRREVENLRIEHGRSPASRYVTLSLGVATVMPGPGSSMEFLIDAADRALYQAKADGRNRVVCLPAP